MRRFKKVFLTVLISYLSIAHVALAEVDDINPDKFVSQSPWSIRYFNDKNNPSLITGYILSSVVGLFNSPFSCLEVGVQIYERNTGEKIVNGEKVVFHNMLIWGRCATNTLFGQKEQHVTINIDSSYQSKAKISSTKNNGGTIAFILNIDQFKKLMAGKKVQIIYPNTNNRGPTFSLECFNQKWTEAQIRAGLSKLPKGSSIDNLKCN